jgi:hypothetical protein
MRFWNRLKRHVARRALRARRTGRGPIVLGLVYALVVFGSAAAPAEGRTLAQAQGDAAYYSAVDCPHHSFGKCMRRDSWIESGIGGGRWWARDRGWECNAFEPCAFLSWTSARWYYEREFVIENDGSRSHVSAFMG